MRDAARRVHERWDAFWPGHGEPLTLVHGDYHPKQMFFPSAQGGRFAVFDWQAVSAYPAAMDVHRVMLFGLSRVGAPHASLDRCAPEDTLREGIARHCSIAAPKSPPRRGRLRNLAHAPGGDLKWRYDALLEGVGQ